MGDKIAALVPPARAHRHRYYDQRKSLWDGVLAPNASLRAAVTALAPVALITPPPAPATEEAPHRAAARYLWAMLLARIYAPKEVPLGDAPKEVPWRDEALPLSCPICQLFCKS